MTTRGIRTNNPGNIRAVDGVNWQGQTGADEFGMCTFDTMANGVRALGVLLMNYQAKHDVCTIRGIVSRYAPPGNADKNDTAAYIADVSRRTGISPDLFVNTRDPYTLERIATAMMRHECGTLPPPDDIVVGLGKALAHA